MPFHAGLWPAVRRARLAFSMQRGGLLRAKGFLWCKTVDDTAAHQNRQTAADGGGRADPSDSMPRTPN